MGGGWTNHGIQLSCFVFFIFAFEIQGCWSLNSEGLALLKFRSNVDFDPSGALKNWNSNDCDPCMWSGVHCQDGRVHMIDLNGHNLVGELAAELGNLQNLRFLDLSKNHLWGPIPQQFGQLTALEVLDLRDNNLTGSVPEALGKMHSLKRLSLRNNRFEGSIPLEIGVLSLQTNVQFDDSLTAANARICRMNRKFGHHIWQSVLKQSKKSDSFQIPITSMPIRYLNLLPQFKIGSKSLQSHVDDSPVNLINSTQAGVIQNVDIPENNARRLLVEQSSNLAANTANFAAPTPVNPVIALPSSRSSGSFPAIPNKKKLSPAPVPTPNLSQEHKPHDATNPVENSPGAVSQPSKHSSDDGKSWNLKLVIGISSAVFVLLVVAAMFVICRSRAARTIGPWKTGLSGQLQKAFVTGVPKLNRAELETACEDFSNIIITYDSVATVYKGTLSSGVEIAVVSTAISSVKDWSKHSEIAFRKKIDGLSRVNHKNFVNLIGYCEENEPFTRMMVFEYAPNGTLFEHLHVIELEHLDWNARMRIIMGTAYCLQYMHDLNPPVAHPNLTSKEIFLTDDYAAKIGDISFWAELVAKSKNHTENESNHAELRSPLADVETNVQSFGIMLLEIISGKLPYSEEQGHLINWAAQYLNDKRTIGYLIDQTLKSFKDNELDVVCEVIQNCIQPDKRKRPTMKEIIQMLRQALDISPDAATPRLSPLWWAELEILSAEAA